MNNLCPDQNFGGSNTCFWGICTSSTISIEIKYCWNIWKFRCNYVRVTMSPISYLVLSVCWLVIWYDRTYLGLSICWVNSIYDKTSKIGFNNADMSGSQFCVINLCMCSLKVWFNTPNILTVQLQLKESYTGVLHKPASMSRFSDSLMELPRKVWDKGTVF